MDNLAAQISELLESPDGMDRIRQMASMLTSGKEEDAPKPTAENPLAGVDMDKLRGMASALMGTPSAPPAESSSQDGLSLSPGEIQTMMKVMNALRSGGTDERSRLLLALRPYLSERRRQRVDSAVKILRLVSILPLLKDSGLSLF